MRRGRREARGVLAPYRAADYGAGPQRLLSTPSRFCPLAGTCGWPLGIRHAWSPGTTGSLIGGRRARIPAEPEVPKAIEKAFGRFEGWRTEGRGRIVGWQSSWELLEVGAAFYFLEVNRLGTA